MGDFKMVKKFLILSLAVLTTQINPSFAKDKASDLEKACNKGDSKSCVDLGYMYDEGLGVKQNYQLAFELYKKACDLGNRDGCEYYKEMASYNESNESPKPLGLEVGRTTINEVKKKYALTYLGTDNNTYMEFYKISKKDIPIEGVIDNVLIFDKKGILHALILKFPKDFNETYWDKLFNSLKEKYNLVESNIPFVGDRSATFKSGNTVIYLTSPHLGFEIRLMYASEYYVNLISNKLKKQEENRQKKLKDNL